MGKPAVDHTGKKFGRWTVLRMVSTSPYEITKAYCKCECGAEREVIVFTLVSGSSTSCGCYNKEICSLPPGESSFNKLLSSYKEGAIKRNLCFSLTVDRFRTIVKSNCFYCNKEPNQIKLNRRGATPFLYNGIDRLDNSIGYTTENCVPCCKDCNAQKGYISFDMIKKICKTDIYQNYLVEADE